jgi:elongation of very long chain fatty acids protein 6
MCAHPAVPILAVLLYGAAIVTGQKYFAQRKQPWDWRKAMAAWNFALSVFSAVGWCRTAPALAHNLWHYSVQDNVCFNPEAHYGSGSTGLWVQLFILSKFPELLDTFFIVIHQKELIFLHWYHHISVLLYCWHSYVTKAPTGLVFCVMNYAVHAIMYFYYFLMAVKRKPKAFKAVYITAAQISQMVVGVAVTLTGCYVLWWNKNPLRPPPSHVGNHHHIEKDGSGAGTYHRHCWLTPHNTAAALLMYGSYLALFVQFFVQRYHQNQSHSRVVVVPPGQTSSSRRRSKGVAETTGKQRIKEE